MVIVRNEQHRINRGQNAKRKSCKKTGGRGSTSGKRIEESKKTGEIGEMEEPAPARGDLEREKKRGSQRRPRGEEGTRESALATRDPGGGEK